MGSIILHGYPADLRPFMSGKREIKHSLGLKDREDAKAVISDMTKAAHALLDNAKAVVTLPPSLPRSH
jgi:hypothetical protein